MKILLSFLVIGLLGKVCAENGNQLCYPGDNITVSQADSKLNLKSKTIRKPTLDFWEHYWGHVSNPMSDLIFGRPKMPEIDTTHQCHPFSDELSNLLMEEYTFSWMKIVSDVQIIDSNPWWCTNFGTPNHPKTFDEKLTSPHYVCYPKHWTDGIGKFMCDLKHQDQLILRSEKELIWRCIPFEFWCRNINSYHNYMDVIALLLSLRILFQVLSLIAKGIELLTNHVIGPIFPKPAPAA